MKLAQEIVIFIIILIHHFVALFLNDFSDLDPLQGPQWHVRVRMNDDPKCLLGMFILNLIS